MRGRDTIHKGGERERVPHEGWRKIMLGRDIQGESDEIYGKWVVIEIRESLSLIARGNCGSVSIIGRVQRYMGVYECP